MNSKQSFQLSPLVELLGLEGHIEGGWHKELWKSSFTIPQSVLPEEYTGDRFAASSIYFLLHPGEASEWHVVHSDELWLWHTGGPLALTLGGDGEEPVEGEEIILGPDTANGQTFQGLVPGKHWQKARPIGSEPVLVTCIVAPGFHYDDFKMIERK